MYIGSGAGFQNQDYPGFFVGFGLDSDSDFGFITWLERAANGGEKLPVELFYPCDVECEYEFERLCLPSLP